MSLFCSSVSCDCCLMLTNRQALGIFWECLLGARALGVEEGRKEGELCLIMWDKNDSGAFLGFLYFLSCSVDFLCC